MRSKLTVAWNEQIAHITEAYTLPSYSFFQGTPESWYPTSHVEAPSR